MTDKKLTEVEELESELRVWELKLKVQKAKFDYQTLKRAMNDVPEPKQGISPEPY